MALQLERNFRAKVDKALERVRLVLEVHRNPCLAENVHHKYEDKYLLTERMLHTLLASQVNSLALLGLDAEKMRQLIGWKASTAVSLRFRAEEKCSFVREVKREVEDKTKHVTEGNILTHAFAFKSKVVTTVTEYFWHHEVCFRLEAVRGVGATENDRLVFLEHKDQHEIKTSSRESPKPEVQSPAIDVDFNLTWMLKQLTEDLVPMLRINRALPSCRTPRRNAEVEAALDHVAAFTTWASSIQSYLCSLYKGLRSVQPSESFVPILPVLEDQGLASAAASASAALPALPSHLSVGDDAALQIGCADLNSFLAEELRTLQQSLHDASDQAEAAAITIVFTDTDGDIIELRYEGVINEYVNGELAVPDIKEFTIDVATREYSDSGGRGSFRPGEDLDDIIRRRDRLFAAALRGKGNLPVSKDEGPWHNAVPAVRIVVVLAHCRDACDQTQGGLDYIEGMIRKQLVAAIGKEVGPSDFTEYMIFHMRRLFQQRYLPKPFSLPVRRSSEHTPEGTVSIEQVLTSGGANIAQPIFTLDACSTAHHPMKFALSASSSVTFHGDRHLHAYLRHQFSEDPGVKLDLVARARQFSSMIVLVGRVVSAHVFEPKAAAIVQNKDELTIPLDLSTIPTAKEFKDAIESLSPEQQEFAKAFRAMQLESTLFGLLVIPIKPQLEAVLNVPPDALTKEIKLTQDLMQLFIKYQIPSDLLSYAPAADLAATPTTAAAAVEAVQAHTAEMMKMLDEARQEEVRAREEEARFQREKELARRAEEEARRMANQMELEMLERRVNECQTLSASIQLCSAAPMSRKESLGSTLRKKAGSVMKTFSATSDRRSLKCDSSALERECSAPESLRRSSKAASPAASSSAPVVTDGLAPVSSTGEGQAQNSGGEPSEPAQSQETSKGQQVTDQSKSGGGGAASTPSAVIRDYTTVPAELDRRCETFDTEGALRPTIINLGEVWRKRSQKALLAKPSEETLNSAEQKREKDAAFDLLDALTKSGSLPVESASLHIVVAATHCFDKTVLEAVVQDNVNPIEKVERSALLMATTVHQAAVPALIQQADGNRLGPSSQLLLQDQP